MTAYAIDVMTFNLRTPVWRDGADAWRYRKGRAAQAIAAAAPDIVGTQEGTVPMIAELTNRLPGYAWLGEGRRGGAKDETNAILYREDRFLPETSGTFWLSESPDRPGSRSWGSAYPRICTWAVFRDRLTESAPRFAVFNTHLDHLSAQARSRGAKLVASRIDEVCGAEGIAAVLTGDFNAKPRAEAIGLLRRPPHAYVSAYDVCPGGPGAVGATYHAFRGGTAGEPIDYVFATEGIAFERVRIDRSRYDGRFPSDHYPVVARAAIGPTPR